MVFLLETATVVKILLGGTVGTVGIHFAASTNGPCDSPWTDPAVLNTILLIVLALVGAKSRKQLDAFRPIRAEDIIDTQEGTIDGEPVIQITKRDTRKVRRNTD